MTWQEYSTWFSERVKPAVESFFIGLIAAVTYEFGNYVMTGGDLSFRPLLVFIVSACGNYVTSRMRRNNAKQLTAKVHATKEALQQVSLERDIANKQAGQIGQGQ